MKQYIVDAFTREIFHGNQAAICVLDHWLPEELMMNITRENNFSETAFTVKSENGGYDLRWFTPGGEINLCGHATMATSYVLFHFYEPDAEQITFHTLSGDLYITREGEYIVMDFPAYKCNEVPVTDTMAQVFGTAPVAAYLDRDLLLVYESEEAIRQMTPDFDRMLDLPGLSYGVTAPGKDYDCVSRFFAPRHKVNEDPVTGSVHCMIAPYWANRLGKNSIMAYQASARGGELLCEVRGDRVLIKGTAALFASADLSIS